MSWADIRRNFIAACGQAPTAAQQANTYLNEGYRAVVTRVDLQQLDRVFEVQCQIGVDYVPMPDEVFHIEHMEETTNSVRLLPEPGGTRGRGRYFSSNGKPSAGAPRYYALSDGKIWLRDTPDQEYPLRVTAKAFPAAVDDTMMNLRPVTPPQYDLAIVFAAARTFYLVHPEANISPTEGAPLPADAMANAFEAAVTQQQLPKDRERFDHSGRFYVRGFSGISTN